VSRARHITGQASRSGSVSSGNLATTLAFLTAFSAFASSLGLTNALLRIGFALTRDGFLSRSLAVTHPRFKSPYQIPG
jgi:amino acid transporter